MVRRQPGLRGPGAALVEKLTSAQPGKAPPAATSMWSIKNADATSWPPPLRAAMAAGGQYGGRQQRRWRRQRGNQHGLSTGGMLSTNGTQQQ